MEVVILEDARAVGELVADAVAELLQRRPQAVLGLATGSSPLPTYRSLVQRYEAGELSFARTHAVLLDEYVGLRPTHPQAYREVIRREFTGQVDLAPENLHAPQVHETDIASACSAYEELLAALGGVDLQLLGIGSDGHIGFNEPISSLRSRTRIKTLTERTRADNARFFSSLDEVPRHVVTQGLGTILDARHLVLVACGESKAAPIAAAVEGPLSARCPASVLQAHPHVTVALDEAAAAQLELRSYYRETWRHKPTWQGL